MRANRVQPTALSAAARTTRLRTLRAALFLSALVLAALAPHASARACSRAALAVAVSNLTSVPANLVFFEVLDATGDALRLVDARTEQPIPASLRMVGDRRVFAPDQTPPVGAELALLVFGGPPGADPAAAPVERHPFVTTAPVELNLRPVELTEIDHDGLNVTFQYSLPEEYEHIKHLLRVRFRLDGELLASEGSAPNTITVHTNCDGVTQENSCTGIESIAAGEHVLALALDLVGVPGSSVRVERAFETSCANGCSTAGGSANAGFFALLALALLVRRRSARIA